MSHRRVSASRLSVSAWAVCGALSFALWTGCSGAQVAPPPPGTLFDPAPNHDFQARTGAVRVLGLEGHHVCFTTDGTEPTEAAGSCDGETAAALPDAGVVTLTCGPKETSRTSIHGLKVAFDWGGRDGQTASANYTLDCTPPPSDRDHDDVADAQDNCPDTPNPDQKDSNHNGIGDACEDSRAPDQDCDGRPDSADNCRDVWNVDQRDDDNDGQGNVCDATPQGPAVLPWDNDVLARAFVKWRAETKCQLNGCKDATGLGSWNANCQQGGKLTWDITIVSLSSGRSTFTFNACKHTVSVDVHDYANDPTGADAGAVISMPITLIADGSFSMVSDTSGNGEESGTVKVTGSFTGTVASHVVYASKNPTQGTSYDVACTADPLAQADCAPNNVSVKFRFPDWSCDPKACPAPAAPLRDTDGDGVFDPYDNCPTTANPTQANADFDELGDACDPTPHGPAGDIGLTCGGGMPDGGVDPSPQPSRDGGTGPKPQLDGGAAPAPDYVLVQNKLGHCLAETSKGDIRASPTCDAADPMQRWHVLDSGDNTRNLRNDATGDCLLAASWGGAIGMGSCIKPASLWMLEANTQNTLAPAHPMRLKSKEYGYCVTDHPNFGVMATQGNCGLFFDVDNRKWGLYPGGDFNKVPLQP